MTLTAPLALALSALAAPIVLMYILKLRRQEHVVPSLLLWRRATDDVQANAPWQRLRPNLLLLLQLLALAALVLTLAGPAYTQARTFDGDLVVIVDQSFSMQARDVAPSRFAVALRRAHDLAANLGSGHVMSVIGMGAEPTLAVADSADRAVIGRAIDRLHVGVQPPNLLGAFSLAASLARRGQSTRVIILTSRESGIAGVPLQAPVSTEIVRVGGRLHDLGITAFSVAGGKALLRVGNFGASAAASDLDLFADGSLIDVRPLNVRPGQEQSLLWNHLPPGVRQLRAHLTLGDDMATDKTAWVVVPAPAQRRVLLVTKGDYFLQTALSLDPSVHLNVTSPDQYASALPSGYDLIVFDGTLPASLPNASVLLVGPPTGSVGPLHFGPERAAGLYIEPASGQTAGALLQDVTLSDVHVAQAHVVHLPGWVQPAARSGSLTLIAAGDNGHSRLAVLTFRLKDSDWPLRVSFPLVIQNLVSYLAPTLTVNLSGSPGLVSPAEAGAQTGQQVRLLPSPGATEMDITRPDGKVDRLRSPFPPFTDTGQPGIYTVRELGASLHATASFALNFFPSHAAPAGGPDVLDLGGSRGGNRRTTSTLVGIAWVFGLVWLALLSTEWWFAFRPGRRTSSFPATWRGGQTVPRAGQEPGPYRPTRMSWPRRRESSHHRPTRMPWPRRLRGRL